MPILRLNAEADRLAVHGASVCARDALWQAARGGDGPILVMIHGYKYHPGDPQNCPHLTLFAPAALDWAPANAHWLSQLGFESGCADEGLAIPFGWAARGWLQDVARRARSAGQVLAQTLRRLKAAAPERPVHLLTHSMGSELALEALHHLPPGGIQRIIALNAASYQSRARAALESPAGRQTEFINVTSAENAVFDLAFEWMIPPPQRNDRALGAGLAHQNALTLRLDCGAGLRALARFGHSIAPPRRRICHWSAYTRPGALRFYQALFREPERLRLEALRTALPEGQSGRFARLFDAPLPRAPLPVLRKGASY